MFTGEPEEALKTAYPITGIVEDALSYAYVQESHADTREAEPIQMMIADMLDAVPEAELGDLMKRMGIRLYNNEVVVAGDAIERMEEPLAKLLALGKSIHEIALERGKDYT